MEFKKIAVIGLGYIGLPTAAMFASFGRNVVGVDVAKNVVDTINEGRIHIVEPGLDELVKNVILNKRFKATREVEPADAFIIAVPTPFSTSSEAKPIPDVSFIKEACRAIAPVLIPGNLIILESTSPVGTTEQMCEWISEMRSDLALPSVKNPKPDIFVAYCPERVLPGNVIEELLSNDRIIGGITAKCSQAAASLYTIFLKGKYRITNARTAELSKLTENASRDAQIAFANELSMICDELNVNPWELIALANKHPRVDILKPGPGVGGHCIAVDPWFIVSSCPEHSNMISMARNVNNSKTKWVHQKIKTAIGNKMIADKNKRVKIAIYGLAFKPNIDDLRESPALTIASLIDSEFPGDILIIEPNISNLPIELSHSKLVDIGYARTNADLHVILVAHDDFNDADLWKDLTTLDFVGITQRNF